MSELSLFNFRVTIVKLINENNPLSITVRMPVNLVACITSFRLISVRFGLLRILVQAIDIYMFSIPIKIHTMVPKRKKQKIYFLYL